MLILVLLRWALALSLLQHHCVSEPVVLCQRANEMIRMHHQFQIAQELELVHFQGLDRLERLGDLRAK